MSKPEGIPDDIWSAAYAAGFRLMDPAQDGGDFNTAVIAEFILAERERCASVAVDTTKAPAQHNSKDFWVEQIGARVASAIRGQS